MKDMLLLHGAIGSKKQLEPLAAMLQDDFRIHLLNLPGHGGEPFPNGGFSMDIFAKAVLNFLDDKKIDRISFFGYSMGGYVAIYFAQLYPNRVNRIITLATKYHWDEATATKEIKMLQPAVIREKLPAFANELADRHAPLDWEEQLSYTQQLLHHLGSSEKLRYNLVTVPCLLMLGDRDKMVSLTETSEVYRSLPNAALAILPQTGHPIEKADMSLLSFYIEKFLQ